MSPARGTNRALVTVGVAVLLVAAVGFAVHGSADLTPGGGSSPLTGQRWTLTGIVTSGQRLAPSHHFGVASISFGGKGAFVANDGCNDMGGKVRIGRKAMEFGEIMSTAVGCIAGAGSGPDPADPTTAMNELLLGNHRSAAWQITDGHLRLTGPGGDPSLEFTGGLDPFAGVGDDTVTQGRHGQVRYRLGSSTQSASRYAQVAINLDYLLTPTAPTFSNGRAGADSGGYVFSNRTVMGDQVLVSGMGPKDAARFAFTQTGQTPVDLPRFPIRNARHVQAFLEFLPLHRGAYEVIAYDAAGHVLATSGPTHN